MPEFIDAHGIAIVYDVHPADGAARGVVQLLHGFGEHTGRHATTIAALQADGFTVYADDHRGHGRTGIHQHGEDAGARGLLGKLGPGGHRAVVAAEWQLTQLIRDENPDLPLILFGHSWGSFVAQMLLNEHAEAYDALILTGSALLWPGSVNTGALNARWTVVDGSGMEWLSSDPAIGHAFVDDPLTTSVPLTKLLGLVETARGFGRPRKNLGRDVPVLLMVGRDDPVGGPLSNHRLADAYRTRSGLTDVTTLVYPHTRHEIFNDVARDEARADLEAWLAARFPSRD